MSILDRKLRRELTSSLGLLLAIVSIMAVGVACYISMASNYRNLQEAKTRYYAQCRMADFSIELKKAPLADLEDVGELPGVAEIRPRIQFFATVDLDGFARPLNGQVLSLPDRREPVIDDVVLRRGSYFTDRRENEVIVNDAFAAHHRLQPGQWIHLVLNNRRQEMLIVGTAISSEFAYLLGPGAIVPDPEHFGVFYIKNSFAEDAFDFDGAANQVLGRLAPGMGNRTGETLDRAERILAPYGVFSTTPARDQASNRFLSQEIDGLRAFAVVMPAIFLGVAAAVINVLLSRLAEQQRTVVGTLKALGYTNAQVFFHFLKFGLVLGVIGAALGSAMGYGFGGMLTSQYRQFYEFPELNNHFYTDLHLTGLAISLACAALGSLRGARAVLRLKPAEAMRPKPPRIGHSVVLERIGWLWTRLSTGWRMVLRGTLRNRMRTAAGAFAAAMGAAVLTNGFMMAQGTNYLIDFQFEWVQRSDVDLTFKDERGREALWEAQALPGVDLAEPVLNVAGDFRHGPYKKKGGITGLVQDARLTVPRDLEAKPIPIRAVGLTMSRKLAEILHVEQGDVVEFQPTKGLRDWLALPVVEISESYLGTSVYANIEYMSRLLKEEMILSGVQLATDNDPEHRAALYRELKTFPSLEAVNSRADMVANLRETLIQSMYVFILIFILFAGIVFFGSILNASLISLAERRREIATLRVLGYGPWEVGSLLLRESMITTVVGALAGMPLGYGLSWLTAVAYESELFRFPVVATSATWIATGALAVAFGLSAHLFVQWAVHRLDWLEALQAKE
ncbi:MAG: ABC transporter permease [Pirellulales bacterium]|nr:ABC transporter permease [Pirellulales bacterium]